MAQSYLMLETSYMEGDDVQRLQETLNLLIDPGSGLPYYSDTIDGVFGPATRDAVV
jgi:peptidoglycan hydrolase-like protein with peptidoglycan-binding domain